MPFINSKVSITITDEKKETIKSKLGKIIELIPGKSQEWLMVGFEDNCSLYFKGTNDRPTAFIEVKIFGNASEASYNKLTEAICNLFYEELQIPKDRIYVKYEEVYNWGYNGSNF